MAKPDDIPQDVWEAAFTAHFNEPLTDKTEAAMMPLDGLMVRQTARAIIAERERCSKIAEDDRAPYHGKPKSIARETSLAIAQAIRGTK